MKVRDTHSSTIATPFPQESPHSKWEEALLIQCFHREQEKPALDLQNPGERVSLRHGLVIPAPMKRWAWGMRCNPVFGGRDRKTPEPHWPTSLTHFVNSRWLRGWVSKTQGCPLVSTRTKKSKRVCSGGGRGRGYLPVFFTRIFPWFSNYQLKSMSRCWPLFIFNSLYPSSLSAVPACPWTAATQTVVGTAQLHASSPVLQKPGDLEEHVCAHIPSLLISPLPDLRPSGRSPFSILLTCPHFRLTGRAAWGTHPPRLLGWRHSECTSRDTRAEWVDLWGLAASASLPVWAGAAPLKRVKCLPCQHKDLILIPRTQALKNSQVFRLLLSVQAQGRWRLVNRSCRPGQSSELVRNCACFIAVAVGKCPDKFKA